MAREEDRKRDKGWGGGEEQREREAETEREGYAEAGVAGVCRQEGLDLVEDEVDLVPSRAHTRLRGAGR